MDERAGVLLRYAEGDGTALGFVPAAVASRLVALSSRTPVPGVRAPALGIALAEGAVVTVLEVGSAPCAPDDDWPVPGADRALLCRVGGIDLAITGGVVLATGLFDAAPRGGVRWRGASVPLLDVAAIYAQAEAAVWADRAARSAPPRRVVDGGEGS